MLQQIDFTAKEKESNITESFQIESNDPTRVQLINIFIHLELFFNKMFYPAEEVHNTYLKMLETFGVLEQYNKKRISKNFRLDNETMKDFEIDTYNKFINKIKEDEGFSHFIYDFLKETL